MHFMLYLGNLCLIQGNKDLLLCCFIILAFTLKSLIHFGLTFLYGTRCGSKFCLFVCLFWVGVGEGCRYLIVPENFVEKTAVFPLSANATSGKK